MLILIDYFIIILNYLNIEFYLRNDIKFGNGVRVRNKGQSGTTLNHLLNVLTGLESQITCYFIKVSNWVAHLEDATCSRQLIDPLGMFYLFTKAKMHFGSQRHLLIASSFTAICGRMLGPIELDPKDFRLRF